MAQFGAAADVLEDALNVAVILASPGVEADAAWVAIEQRGSQVRFQHADAVGDGASEVGELDYLKDTNDNGVGDVNERLMGTDPADAESTPGASAGPP